MLMYHIQSTICSHPTVGHSQLSLCIGTPEFFSSPRSWFSFERCHLNWRLPKSDQVSGRVILPSNTLSGHQYCTTMKQSPRLITGGCLSFVNGPGGRIINHIYSRCKGQKWWELLVACKFLSKSLQTLELLESVPEHLSDLWESLSLVLQSPFLHISSATNNNGGCRSISLVWHCPKSLFNQRSAPRWSYGRWCLPWHENQSGRGGKVTYIRLYGTTSAQRTVRFRSTANLKDDIYPNPAPITLNATVDFVEV